MSYIHEALKKAQREKDYLASKCKTIWPGKSKGKLLSNRNQFITAGVVVIAIAFSSYSWLQSVDSLPTGDNTSSSGVYRGVINATSGMVSNKASRPSERSRPEGKQAARPVENDSHNKAPQQRYVARQDQPKDPAKAYQARNTSSFSDEGTELYKRALSLQKEGKHQEAIGLYKAALKRSPNLVSALNNLGTIYIQQKNFTEARKVLEKAIRTDANFVDPYYNLACLHAQQKDIGRSLFYLKKAVSVDSSARSWAKMDEDLKNLRGHVEYEKIIRGTHNS